jgi:hypothetical protein
VGDGVYTVMMASKTEELVTLWKGHEGNETLATTKLGMFSPFEWHNCDARSVGDTAHMTEKNVKQAVVPQIQGQGVKET